MLEQNLRQWPNGVHLLVRRPVSHAEGSLVRFRPVGQNYYYYYYYKARQSENQ